MSRCGMLLMVAADALAFNASDGILCGGAAVVKASGDWLWSHNAVPSPSCTSPSVENPAEMCKGDPTSVVLRGNGQAQCLSTEMSDCKFDMRDVEQLDFDINMLGCKGTWAAPLWMNPNRWLGGGNSGEIDMLENCPTDRLASNFAGGGNQVSWPFADTDSFQGHTTMWKQADGDGDGVMSIHVKTCNTYELDSSGACPETGDVAYLHDIYGKNGCSNGGDCIYRLVSDIWNGLSGDAGYQGCAGGKAHYSAGCSSSVANIRFKASSGTFVGKCAALVSDTPSPSPAPSPGPAPTPSPGPAPTPSPGPAPTPSPGGWQPCFDGICCNPYTATPQHCPDGEQCQECGGGDACQCPGSLGAVVV